MHDTPSASRSPLAWLVFLGTSALGLAADQLAKVWSFRVLEIGGDAYRFLPGWLHFEVTENRGAVFGLAQGQRWLFVTVSFFALGFLTYLFASKSSGRQYGYHILLGMLLAGVLGNLYDRLVFGYVRDMIHALPRWPKLFPYIFNFADTLLCTGVFLMIVYNYLHGTPAPSEARKRRSQMNTDEPG